LDRAVRLHQSGQLITDHADRWESERDLVRAWVNEHCWSDSLGSYTFYAGSEDLDAATLLLARTGFDRGERLAGTVRAVRDKLSDGPLVYRYSGVDDDGAFVACTFWLVLALVHLGELDDARALMDDAVRLCNDVGLLAEEIDPGSGAMLGNFPQGLSHLALVNAACAYDRATS
jgi:GH15 family glucan-1,4-alpha-glucosidase